MQLFVVSKESVSSTFASNTEIYECEVNPRVQPERDSHSSSRSSAESVLIQKLHFNGYGISVNEQKRWCRICSDIFDQKPSVWTKRHRSNQRDGLLGTHWKTHHYKLYGYWPSIISFVMDTADSMHCCEGTMRLVLWTKRRHEMMKVMLRSDFNLLSP